MFLRLLSKTKLSTPVKPELLSATHSIARAERAVNARNMSTSSVIPSQEQRVSRIVINIKRDIPTLAHLSSHFPTIIDSPLAFASYKSSAHFISGASIFSRAFSTETPQVLNHRLIEALIADLKIEDLIAHDKEEKIMMPEEFESQVKLLAFIMKLRREMRYAHCKNVTFNKQLHSTLEYYVAYRDLPCQLDAIKIDFPNASEDFLNLMQCLESSQEIIMNYVEMAEPILHKEIFAKATLFSQQFFLTFMTPDNNEDDLHLNKKNNCSDDPAASRGLGSKY